MRSERAGADPAPSRRAAVRRRAAVLATLALVVVAACSEAEDAAPTDPDPDGTDPTAPACAPDVPIVECAPDGTTFAPRFETGPEPADPDAEPLVIGMINQESGVTGSFPELSRAARAFVAWANDELGGVDGRRLELEVCDTEFSPAGSQSCAQAMVDRAVPVVAGGIDVFGGGIEILEENGIPLVGGIPISFASVENPYSFQLSGGSWGAALAFAWHAVEELAAERVSIVYGEFGSIEDAAGYGRDALVSAGLDPGAVRMVPFPITSEDLLAPLGAANEQDPDAIFVLTADTGCGASFQAARDLGITAQLYFVGACAAPPILASAGDDAVEGHIFNVEGPVGGGDADTTLYNEVIERYGDGLDPAGAGTVTFRALANLYLVLRDLGGDGITSDAVVAALRGSVDRPSFMGHPYTCDGQQLGGDLPSICSPQQILARQISGEFEQITDWIDVGALRR